jgi:uncharacterized protein (DUF2236 family)
MDSQRPSTIEIEPITSVTWKIHREVVLLLGWARAILLQISHPLVARGVADHSTFLVEGRARWRRLQRTLDAMLTLTFGTADQAAEVARGINAIHDRVHGQLREPTRAVPDGRVYSAHNPELLGWVHATLLDSFLLTYELYVGSLTLEEKDRYCAEASAIEPLLGIPPGRVPASLEGLQHYMAEMLASGEIRVTDTARTLAREIVSPPLPRAAGPIVWLMQLPAVGLLPPPIREAYGLAWDSRRQAALRLSAGVVRRLLPVTPSVLRHWPAARAAFRRERGSVWIAESGVA